MTRYGEKMANSHLDNSSPKAQDNLISAEKIFFGKLHICTKKQ